MTSSRTAAADDLKSFVERIERIGQERKELGDEQRALFAEAKARGFDPKAMRKIIKRRDQDPAELAEQETIFDSYMAALGMIPETPLHAQIAALAADGMARDQVIEALQKMVPANGEIIARVGGAAMRIWRTEDGTAFAREYVEPKTAPAEKTGKGLGKSAAVLSIVPKDAVTDAADAAERRARRPKPADETVTMPPAPAGAEQDEPVE